MHDDHFLVIEAAQSWVDGFDYNGWLPQSSPTGEPTGHSFFYVGLHFIFFYVCKVIGVVDPQVKMLIVRFLHGAWSMLTVYFGYKITEKISGKEEAGVVGMLLALLWFYPILSVRNMVELVCVPFLLSSFYCLVKEKQSWKAYALAGLFMGLAIAIRIQTYLIFGGIGLVLLYERKIIYAIIFGVATIASLFLTQLTDIFLWGYPFAEMSQYISYNTSHYEDYITQSWYQYFLLIAGLLIPPVSLFLIFGFFRTWKKHALFFLPTLIFLVFHSIYPNKQERFILPILPLIIMLGVIGWLSFKRNSTYWLSRPRFYKGILTFFWTLNIIALLFISPASTKSSRVNSMYSLSKIEDVHGLLLERSENYGCYLMPRFYHGNWRMSHLCYSKEEISKYKDLDFEKEVRDRNINYCLFLEEENIESRRAEIKKYFPDMTPVLTVEPSYIDKLMHFLNPRNQNEVIFIYRLY
jgi:hypothetical protein